MSYVTLYFTMIIWSMLLLGVGYSILHSEKTLSKLNSVDNKKEVKKSLIENSN
jgi:hypothetical protein